MKIVILAAVLAISYLLPGTCEAGPINRRNVRPFSHGPMEKAPFNFGNTNLGKAQQDDDDLPAYIFTEYGESNTLALCACWYMGGDEPVMKVQQEKLEAPGKAHLQQATFRYLYYTLDEFGDLFLCGCVAAIVPPEVDRK